jgi:hypothetical protein
MPIVKPRHFTDAGVQALREFDIRGTFRDADVKGLRLRVGAKRMSWYFFAEHRFRGSRSTTCKLLGHFPDTSRTLTLPQPEKKL